MIDTSSKHDRSFITDDSTNYYHKKLLEAVEEAKKTGPSKNMQQRFAKSNPQLVQLLECMLEYNPVYRPSAAELVKLPLFDALRLPKSESYAMHQSKDPVDLRFVDDDKSLQLKFNDLESWRTVSFRSV